VEMGSHVGKTDKQFAEESWQDHLKRNDSIIVDLFGGGFSFWPELFRIVI